MYICTTSILSMIGMAVKTNNSMLCIALCISVNYLLFSFDYLSLYSVLCVVFE